MRTKVFLSVLVGLFVTLSISAKNPETTTFSNVEVTATGSIKEFTTFATETNQPMQRSVYKYDLQGNIQEKVVYTWNGDKGWTGVQKLEYAYDNPNVDKPTSLTHTKWDDKTNNWSKHTRVVAYNYGNDGETTVTTSKN